MRAEPDGSGWRLNGEKLWISNAPEADIYTVFARTGGPGARGVSAFAVPGDAAGLSGRPLELLAPHAIGSLTFDDVFVAREQLLGAEGDGFRVAMRTLNLFRPSVGAFAVGMARTAISLAAAHANGRRAFGRPLKDNQAVSHRLADVSARVEAARLLVHQAAAAHDAGIPDPALAAMAKLTATETAQDAVDAAIQIHGAAGLERGHPLEHLYRDVRAPRIYEGASEIQREIIARALFGASERGRAGSVDFGVYLPVSGAAATRSGLIHAAQTAERLGFSTVWAADRIIIPWQIETSYAYSWSGSFIVPPDKPFLETMTALAFLAGATERIRLGIAVLVMTYRDPIHWAKVAATIDRLSEGRFILGVGIGWMQEEFDALGRGELFARRGAVGDEQLHVVRNLFTEEHCSFDGDFYRYDDIAFSPKPSLADLGRWREPSRTAARRGVRRRVVPVLPADHA